MRGICKICKTCKICEVCDVCGYNEPDMQLYNYAGYVLCNNYAMQNICYARCAMRVNV